MSKIFPINKMNPDEDDDLSMALQDTLGLNKVKSSDCLQAIMAQPQFSDTNPKDWKRKSKRKDQQGNWVRLFENKTTGATTEITETKGGVFVNAPGTSGAPSSNISLLPLIPPVRSPEQSQVNWTGRVGFSIEESEDDEVCFYCGPETTRGYIDDTFDGDLSPKLEALFADFDIMVQDAENYHTINLTEDMSQEQVINIVKQRLIAAGAVPLKW